jgi:hypothetical protein
MAINAPLSKRRSGNALPRIQTSVSPFLRAMCQGGTVKVSRRQGVKANFHRVALEASRPAAPRDALCPRKDP